MFFNVGSFFLSLETQRKHCIDLLLAATFKLKDGDEFLYTDDPKFWYRRKVESFFVNIGKANW